MMGESFDEMLRRNSLAPLDRRPDLTGLDDGPFLPGQAPRKKAALKSAEENAAIRSSAWATRRAKFRKGE